MVAPGGIRARSVSFGFPGADSLDFGNSPRPDRPPLGRVEAGSVCTASAVCQPIQCSRSRAWRNGCFGAVRKRGARHSVSLRAVGEGAALFFEKASLGGVDAEFDGAFVGGAGGVALPRSCEEVGACRVVGLVVLEQGAVD
jgi:hypothetical protein